MSGPAPGIAPIEGHERGRVLRWVVLAVALLFLATTLLLPLVNINRYHRTIADSLSRSLGRPVHLGSVKLQMLPHPGLAISDFVVEEDPGFGAEPLLRAPSVAVSLRFTSLWRGRLEVSRIDLDGASVNLVRDVQGNWNFSSLLVQASRTPNAPTAQRHAGSALRFPYIEFRAARFNFKEGYEKKAFSFLNADLSIWLANPDRWQLRFEAQPARTDLDLDLADTGLMRIEGSFDRAAALDQIPVKLHTEWTGAPLGQASRLMLGEDSGWRGDMRVEADIAGDMQNLQMTTRVRVENAHRQEFTPLRQLNVDARCRAVYQHATRSLEGLTCLWPVEDGHLLLTGRIENLERPRPDLTLEINQIPVRFGISLLGLLRHGMAQSLDATGFISGRFSYTGGAAFSGQATLDSLAVNLPGASKPQIFPALHFATPTDAPPAVVHHGRHIVKTAPANSPVESTILLEATPVAMGAPNPLVLSGQFSRTGFSLRLAGQSGLDALRPWSGAVGLMRSSIPAFAPMGTADMDLTLAGPWMANGGEDHAEPLTSVQGWLRVQHAQIKTDWLPEVVEVASASAEFTPGKVTWSNASFTINDIAARGSASYPTFCGATTGCAAHFNLDVPVLDAAVLVSALLGAGRHGELLSAILAQVERKTAPWPALEGAVHAGSFSLGNLTLHDTRALIAIRGGKLEISSLDADALAGSLHASGNVVTTGNLPAYSLDLNWTGINVGQVAGLFHEKWGAGTMNGGATIALRGYSAADLTGSAHGTFHWDWSGGTLSSAVEDEAAQAAKFSPAHFSRWVASGTIGDGKLAIGPASSSKNAIGPAVSGNIGFDRSLDLLWPIGDGPPLHLQGTLTQPVD